jgi:hypothetical protein
VKTVAAGGSPTGDDVTRATDEQALDETIDETFSGERCPR